MFPNNEDNEQTITFSFKISIKKTENIKIGDLIQKVSNVFCVDNNLIKFEVNYQSPDKKMKKPNNTPSLNSFFTEETNSSSKQEFGNLNKIVLNLKNVQLINFFDNFFFPL